MPDRFEIGDFEFISSTLHTDLIYDQMIYKKGTFARIVEIGTLV